MKAHKLVKNQSDIGSTDILNMFWKRQMISPKIDNLKLNSPFASQKEKGENRLSLFPFSEYLK